MDTELVSDSTPQRQLPPAVQLHILSFLSPHDRALNGRLVCRDAADSLSEPQHCTASFSLPLPPHSARWALEAVQLHARTLSFHDKLLLLSTAAASGSEVNLEAALAVLRASIFVDVLHQRPRSLTMEFICPDPGVAAVKAGQPHLLGWLMRHCPALLRPERVLEAAARYCDLAGLKAAWEVMTTVSGTNGSSDSSTSSSSRNGPGLGQLILDAAAESAAPDAVAKMEWVLASGRPGSCSLTAESTAKAAIRSGDLDRLRWLQDRGCHFAGDDMVECALRHANLAVVQWLVDEAGYPLDAAHSGSAEWLCKAAARSPDGVAKLRWLQEQGAQALDRNSELLRDAMCEAVVAGQVEVLRYLLTMQGAREALQAESRDFVEAAAKRSSVEVAECLRQAGLAFRHTAYGEAAWSGSLPMIRWLAHEARVSTAGRVLLKLSHMCNVWPRGTPGHNRDLLEAVQLVVGAGGRQYQVPGGGGNVAGAGAGLDSDEDTDSDSSSYVSMDSEDSDDALDGQLRRRWKVSYSVLSGAMCRGDLALVQYLVQRELVQRPQGQEVDFAARAGCEELLEWVVGHQACPQSLWSPYGVAAANGDVGTLVALRRLGVPWGREDGLAKVVRRGCVEQALLRWLVEQGVPVGGAREMEEAVKFAVDRQDLGAEAAAWLRGLTLAETR